MKANKKLGVSFVALLMVLSGCSSVGWDSGNSNSSSQQAGEISGESSPTSASQAEAGGEAVIEGKYTIIRKQPAGPDNIVTLREAIQPGGNLIVHWEDLEGVALESVNPKTGESVYRKELDSGVHSVEATNEQPEDYRVAYVDRLEFFSSSNETQSDVRELPESVRSGIWKEYPAYSGTPYDLVRDPGKIAYAAEDGIYVCDLDGSNARKVLDNASIPGWLNYWGMEGQLPEHDNSQLHYIAPLFMNDGKQIAATSYLVGNGDYEPRCIGITAIDLETGQVSNFPDPISWLGMPASRTGVDSLFALGEEGYELITVSTSEVEIIPLGDNHPYETWSVDYKTYAKIETLQYEDEYLEFYLYTTPGDQPEERTNLLKLGGFTYAYITAITQDYIVLEAEDPAGDLYFLAVPYTR